MAILDNIKSFEYDKNRDRIFGIKSAIVWGHSERGTIAPLFYISKPKHINQEDFDYILDRLEITIKR